MAGRIAIPIHDRLGRLVAYCGRAVNQTQIEEEGKYKLPPNFMKLDVVYNLHRIPAGTRPLILVESYISVWRLHQAGFPNVGALMGSVLGNTQEELIFALLGPSGQVLTLFDADEDGIKCGDECLARFGKRLFVKTLDITSFARKPHQLELKVLRTLPLAV